MKAKRPTRALAAGIPLALAMSGTLIAGAGAATVPAPDPGTSISAEAPAATPVTGLQPGGSVEYTNAEGVKTTLTMQTDGTLALVKGTAPVWSIETGAADTHLTVGDDGNVFIYDNDVWAWQTETHGEPGSATVALTDGALVVTRGGVEVFSNGEGRYNADAGYPKTTVEPTVVPAPPATMESVDPINPVGVTNNVAWKDALPADTEQIDWSEDPATKTRTAALTDKATMVWSTGGTDDKVYTLPADNGVSVTVVPAPPATMESVDPPNPAGVTNNVAWKDALPADTEQIDWSEDPATKTRTAALTDKATMVWSTGGTDDKVYTLPADNGETEAPATETPVTSLAPGASLALVDGGRLVMQGDGNLVAYDKDSKATFNTSTFEAGSRLVVQSDGNVVVYDANNRWLWQTGTAGNPDAEVLVENGHLIVRTGETVLFDSATKTGIRNETIVKSMRPASSVKSASGQYMLAMQGDGNLVMYDAAGKPTWSTGTQGNPAARFAVQGDGNLVVYSSAGKALWNTSTQGNTNTRLVLQDDGNLVLYSSAGKALWWSKR